MNEDEIKAAAFDMVAELREERAAAALAFVWLLVLLTEDGDE